MKTKESQNKFLFKVLWSKTYVGIAINEIHNDNIEVPLTTFYFWPREEGWKLLKVELDSKPWIEPSSKKEILNGYTLILNYWLKMVKENSKTIKQKIENLNLNVDIIAMNTIN